MKDNKLKIFVSAYACEPDLGSEIGVGWHWVLEMSKYFDLWVLTRQSNKGSIEGWLRNNELENVPHFIYYDLPKKLRFWKKGLRGVRTYYMLWQCLTDKIVRRTMAENDIEVFHLLTYGNALWRVSKHGQRAKFFIWGPTSAGTYVSSDFSQYYGFKNKTKELAQRLMAKSLRFNSGFQSRCRNASLILCKTQQTVDCINQKYRDKAVVFTDVAIDLIDTSKFVTKRADDGIVRYLAVGRLDAWRGFDLLIEAFASALKKNKNIYLDILGKGSDKERLMQLIDQKGVAKNVSLRGQVTMEQYYQYMADCDVVVNPTLKEGAVTTAFDSMSFAKPLICVNTGGYTRYFNNEYAVVLDLTSRALLIDSLSASIDRLSDKSLRELMSNRIVAVREQFVWARKGEHIRDIILKTVAK